MNLKGIFLVIMFGHSCHSTVSAQLPDETHLGLLNGINGFQFDQEAPNASSYFASDVTYLGDVNGDGISDIAIADTTADPDINGNNTGEVYVIFGSNELFEPELNVSDLNGTNGVTFVGEQDMGQAGWSVSGAGDVNNDGIDDFIIGALTYDDNPEFENGAAYVIYGDVKGFSQPFMLADLDGSNGFKVYGTNSFDFIGRSVNSAGDINQDNIDDIIICSGSIDVGKLTSAGTCFVIFGNDSITSPFDLSTLNGTNGFSIAGSTTNEWIGYASGSMDDFNADGINDIYIGSGRMGTAYVIYGRSTSFNAIINLSDLDGTNGFQITGGDLLDATPINGAGDFNFDGISDLIVGYPDQDNFQGRTYILFGSNSWPTTISLNDLNGNNSFTLLGAEQNDQAGSSVSGAGDVNGDGVDDVIIGSPGSNGSIGQSYVIYGNQTPPTSLNLGELLNNQSGAIIRGQGLFLERSGEVVSCAGDLNNDGMSDLIIAAPAVNYSHVVFSTDVIFINGFD